jgi:glutathione synthase
MVDKIKKFIFQVELNTIASSMGSFSDKIKGFFSYFSKKYKNLFSDYKSENVPLEKENVIDNIASSMFAAVKLFSPSNYNNTIVVFLIQEEERNEFDQRAIEVQLWEKYGIRSLRLTMKEVLINHEIDSNNNMIIDKNIVSLFYFRAGYSEKDYPDEESWKAREAIEMCSAVKCPNIDTFLCTFKIFQYYLKKKENLLKYFLFLTLRYIPEESIINDISRFFTSIYYTGDISDKDELQIILEDVKKNTNKYIVKPMKEGGGNNYYNNDILKVVDSELINTAIIMERIVPPETETLLLENGKVVKKNCVSEVSVYGIILSDDTQIHINKQVGFLLRTKDVSVQEGGVISAAAAIDLPYLVDN